jgi:hypothetical protein
LDAIYNAFRAKKRAAEEEHDRVRAQQLLEDAQRRLDENAGLVEEETPRQRSKRKERQLEEAGRKAKKASDDVFWSSMRVNLIAATALLAFLMLIFCGCLGILLLSNSHKPGQNAGPNVVR